MNQLQSYNEITNIINTLMNAICHTSFEDAGK